MNAFVMGVPDPAGGRVLRPQHVVFDSPAEMVEPLSVFPRPFQIFLGTAEVLAAIGLTLPGITRILPWLVPSAAAD